MKRWYRMALWAAVAGCSSLPVTGDGIVSLELTLPASMTITPEDSLQLFARALDREGETVADAPIRWYTVDTLVATIDSVSGMVRPVAQAGTARIQAGVGTLRSNPVVVTIRPATP